MLLLIFTKGGKCLCSHVIKELFHVEIEKKRKSLLAFIHLQLNRIPIIFARLHPAKSPRE